jgi:Ca2+-binding RTX toxin-like protein
VRFVPGLTLACLLVALLLPTAAVADRAPTCAEGPTTVGGTTYGTPCGDVIVASPRVAAVDGGGGDDTIVAAAAGCPDGCHLGVGSQTFEGGEGDDVVFGERGNDILLGGPGDDQLFGGIGDDLLRGGPGEDRLAGGFGFDSIDGEGGNDYARGDSTVDRIFDTGGDAGDVLSYSTGITPGFGGSSPSVPGSFPAAGGERGLELEMGAGGENADNGIAALGGGVDQVEGQRFEIIVGTPFADHIVGTAEAEAIYGGGGADAIFGNGGGDTIAGGADGDYCVSAGAAISGCEAGAAQRDTGKVSVGFMTPPGATPYAQLYLVGSSGSDSVAASYGSTAVTFQLAAGAFDQSAGDAGGCAIETATEATCPLSVPLDSLLLAGMAGNDTISVSGFPETTGILATGGEGGDSLGGRDGEDILVDGPGAGADTLTASGGDDALTHNDGVDELLGGDGNDLFLSVSICDGEAVVGGTGRDNSSWARFTGGGVQANLELGQAGMPVDGPAPSCSGDLDSLQEIEDLEGSNGEDVFYGDEGPNQLLGHKKADAYFAGVGSDSILANSGDTESGDFDVTIDCGSDADSALIDRPQFGGDPTPVNCESVAEADPNNFRTVTQLPPPPPPEPEEPPPPPPPLDRRAPRTTLAFHPRPRLFSERKWRRVAFSFASNERGSRFRCKLDRNPYRACTSPRAYAVKVGRHVFRVFAVDQAGNRDPSPALFRFRVVRRR